MSQPTAAQAPDPGSRRRGRELTAAPPPAPASSSLSSVLSFCWPGKDDDGPAASAAGGAAAAAATAATAGPPPRRFRVLSARYPEHWTDEGEEAAETVAEAEEHEDEGAAAAAAAPQSWWARAWAPWRRRRRRRAQARPVHFPDNLVSTAKYTWLTFLPRSLFEQFRRLANVYFLVISVLLLIGTYTDLYQSPLTPYTTLIPLCVVLAITMGKEGFEDIKRHTADLKTNNRPSRALSLTAPGAFEPVLWRHIRVGRIVKVLDREEIPADMLLLASSEPGGLCYIQTSNIDGETNLKVKQAAATASDGNGPAFREPADLFGFDAVLECEAPNSRIHTYTGTVHWSQPQPQSQQQHQGLEQEQERRRIPVDQANLLLRGSTLRNTKWALGLVVYTGYETKIVMNSREAPSKLSTIERTTNRLLYLILAAQAALAAITLAAYLAWTTDRAGSLHYLCFDFLERNSPAFYRMNCAPTVDDTSDLGMFVTFLLLFNNMVPISLYVTVEMVNYVQAFFIDQDLEMYDPSTETPAMARTSNMNGDLGSVRYVFSDKTGTLTQNVMRFRRCSVAGQVFGNLGNEDDDGREEGAAPVDAAAFDDRIRAEEGSGASRGSKASATAATAHPYAVEGLPLSELSRRSAPSAATQQQQAEQQQQQQQQQQQLAYRHFAEILAVCHTVVVETTGDAAGTRAYQAESPDEEALVEAAAGALRWEFTGRIPTEAYVTDPEGNALTYKILAVVPFTSTRKRMSVVVRDPRARIVVMTKGADNVIFARAGEYLGTTRAALDGHLSAFAADGLRTLVLARRELSELEFAAWYREFERAATAVASGGGGAGEGDRAERMGLAAEAVETGLTVVGATAIEDKLQDGVPDTIAHLLEAGIKVWVLTGDKMETAINIGYSCRLLDSSMVLIKITDPGASGRALHPHPHPHPGSGSGSNDATTAHALPPEEALRRQLHKLVLHFERLVADESLAGGFWKQHQARALRTRQGLRRRLRAWWRGARGARRGRSGSLTAEEVLAGGHGGGDAAAALEPLLEPQADAPALEDLQSDHLALILDGPALACILGDAEMERLLLRVATLCKSVVACRVSPAQKRMLVRLVKKGVRPKPITLAIGDGANDVSMMREAQIGVGISGREGRQAVNSSDFAIAQFRFLEPLLLKHGRWNYRRISKVITYSFYKNFVLTMILFYYCWFTGFSGQPLFEDYVYSGFNFFLAMPPICIGFFDRDLSPRTVARFRWAYMSGRENLDLNLANMFLWLLQSILDSIILFFLCIGAVHAPQQILGPDGGGVADLYVLGTLAYSAMLLAMLFKAGTNTYTWTGVSWFFLLGSLLLYLAFLLAYGALPVFAGGFYRAPYHMLATPAFWLLMLLVPAVSVALDYVVIYLRLALFPSPVDVAVEFDRGLHPPELAPESLAAAAAGGAAAASATVPAAGAARAERLSLKQHGADHSDEEDEERGERKERGGGGGWWYPGKFLIGLDLLRRLNASASAREREAMGINDASAGGRMASSFDYTGTATRELGPGAIGGEGGGGGVRLPTPSSAVFVGAEEFRTAGVEEAGAGEGGGEGEGGGAMEEAD